MVVYQPFRFLSFGNLHFLSLKKKENGRKSLFLETVTTASAGGFQIEQ